MTGSISKGAINVRNMDILKMPAPIVLAVLIVLRSMSLRNAHIKKKTMLHIHASTVREQGMTISRAILHFITSVLLTLLLKIA